MYQIEQICIKFEQICIKFIYISKNISILSSDIAVSLLQHDQNFLAKWILFILVVSELIYLYTYLSNVNYIQ